MIPKNWPVNWMEQALYAAEIKRRITRLQRIRKTVVVHSKTEPTRSQFESGYLAQTGQPLPIEVGTKLVWFDIRTGQMKGYSTAYDLQDGLVSSGEIYPIVDVYADSKGAFRLLGVHTDSSNWQDPFVSTLGGGLNLRIDPFHNMLEGISGYIVLFEANSSSIPFSYTIRAPADGGVSGYNAIYNVQNAAGGTTSTSPGKTLVTSGNTSGMSEVMCQGLVFIGSAVNLTEDGNQQFNAMAPQGAAFASGFLTSLAANSLRISQMSFIDQRAASPMISLFDPDFSEAPTTRSNGARAWLYGLHYQPTYMLSADGH